MRALIGSPDCEVSAGATLAELATVYEPKFDKDPMIKALRQDTGSSQIVYIVNGVVIDTERLSDTVLRDGDDIRIHHPFFGG